MASETVPPNLNPLPTSFQYADNPSCINDCLPIILAARYCDFKHPGNSNEDINARARCSCNNPYILPLTTGLQCSFLCSRQHRADVVDFMKSQMGCGSFEPWLRASIPGPETYEPKYPPAEAWWRRYRDGERFGIILGCVLGLWFVCYFVWGAVRRIIEIVTKKMKARKAAKAGI